MNLRTGIQFRNTYALIVGEGLNATCVIPMFHIFMVELIYISNTPGLCNIHIFRYNALDALRLISPNDEFFHCEKCNSELVAESDKLAAEEMGDGDDNARRRRREKLKDMLQKMEVHC